MINILAVGIGGFIGAILRYGMGQLSKVIVPGLAFPVATFMANILGAFFIGMAFEYFTKHSTMGSTMQLFIMVGVLGGFTTFSSFSLETMNLIGDGKMLIAFINIIASVAVCLVGVWLGKSVIG